MVDIIHPTILLTVYKCADNVNGRCRYRGPLTPTKAVISGREKVCNQTVSLDPKFIDCLSVRKTKTVEIEPRTAEEKRLAILQKIFG